MESWKYAQKLILALPKITDFVVCPGSRSAPLTLAAAYSDKPVHIRTDERSAGFLALGLAKAGAFPAVIATSGTAIGNLLPAVMEAYHSRISFLILAADRPRRLWHTGASQTTKQCGIFSDFAQVFELANTQSEAELIEVLADALAISKQPVQLNIELDEPLLPDSGPAYFHQENLKDQQTSAFVGDEIFAALHVQQRKTSSAKKLLDFPPQEISLGEYPLVIAGDDALAGGLAAAEFANQTNLPLLAEPSSAARPQALVFGAQILASELGKLVDHLIVFGHPTLHRSVMRSLNAGLRITLVDPNPDIPRPGVLETEYYRAVTASPRSQNWRDLWQLADQKLQQYYLDKPYCETPIFAEDLAAQVVASLAKHPSSQRILVSGPSNPIRDLAFVPFPSGTRCFSNRGLAGIDGVVSTAIGIAKVSGPATLFLGDLTFMHDANGLQLGIAEELPPLRIIVADDQGGSIFANLVYGSTPYAEVFEKFFATPPNYDVAQLASAHGWPVKIIETRAELRQALAQPVISGEVLQVKITRENRRQLARERSEKARQIISEIMAAKNLDSDN